MGETNPDHADKKHVPMQRGARFAFSGSVPMQRGARFGIFGVLWGGPTWPSEGVRNIYKPNVILHILRKFGKKKMPQKRMRETKIKKKSLEK